MDKQFDIITTSLEALLQRGTSPKNVGRDSAAIDAFCGLVKKETECIPTAAKLIVSKMQSMQEWEALQALQLLESCMLHCGPLFHAEVGKFRFLNELIKLISPKYLGSLTPESVRTEIVQLLYLWTLDYPKETKIREAYEMLKKQRVVQSDPIISNRRAPPPPYTPTPTSTSTPSCSLNQSGLSMKPPTPSPAAPPLQSRSSSILEDENQSKLLQKLLQSKKPEDLQAANKLIKSMVSEEERKMEQRCKVMLEMESINNNASLLTEMLDNYTGGDSNDWDLIKELHGTCEGFRSTLVTLAQHLPSGDDDLFQLVISTNESLSEVLAKYTSTLNNLASIQTNTPLLDMSSARPSPQHTPSATGASHLNDLVDLIAQESSISSSSLPPPTPTSADLPPPNNNNTNNVDLLQDLLSNPQQQDVQLLNFTSRNPLGSQTALLNSQNMPPIPSNQIASSQNTIPSSNQHSQIDQTANLIPNSNLSSTAVSNALSSLTQEAFAAASVPNKDISSASLLNLSSSSSSVSNNTPSSFLLHSTSSIPTSVLDSTSTLLNNVSRNSSNVLPSSVPTNSHSTSSVSLSQSNAVPLDLISNASPMSNSILDLTGLGSSNLLSNGLGTSSPAASALNFNHLSHNAPGGQSQNKNITSASSGQNVHFMNKNSSSPNGQNLNKISSSVGVRSPSTANKLKALKDLDELVGESLNRLGLNEESAGAASQALAEKEGTNAALAAKEGTNHVRKVSNGGEDDEQLLLDDFTLEETNAVEKKGANENRDKEPDQTPTRKNSTPVCPTPHQPLSVPCDNAKLADITIRLEDILPSETKPLQAMADVNSMTILVHCTRTRPKRNVPVFVITTMSKHKTPLSRYLFQPVVPKGYKVRLQPPSSTSLPAFNPFLPSPAITQIMLIACPTQSMTDTTLSQPNTPSTLQGNGPVQNTILSNQDNTSNMTSQSSLVNIQGNGPNNTSSSPGNAAPSQINPLSNMGNASTLVSLQGNGPNMDQTCQNTAPSLVNLQGTASNMGSVRENADKENRGNMSNTGPLSENQSSSEVSCSISLKFVVSYEMDGETVSEMGEIRELPLCEL
uniref:ADP-ribosylation factor-binding protein GGA1 n=1 Tax=Cacopsylla melanoneura TaxID=428564 RepID=A0A8D8M7C9_9HEMI